MVSNIKHEEVTKVTNNYITSTVSKNIACRGECFQLYPEKVEIHPNLVQHIPFIR
jgi:hypothetical protein